MCSCNFFDDFLEIRFKIFDEKMPPWPAGRPDEMISRMEFGLRGSVFDYYRYYLSYFYK